jgi:hypothetical protein
MSRQTIEDLLHQRRTKEGFSNRTSTWRCDQALLVCRADRDCAGNLAMLAVTVTVLEDLTLERGGARK